MSSKEIILLSILAVVVLAIGAVVYYSWFYAERILPYGLVIPMRPPLQELGKQKNEALAGVVGIHVDSLWTQPDDSTRVFVYVVRSTNPMDNKNQFISGCNVILLHGIASSKEQMLATAVWIARHGGVAWLPDQRAHGASGGKYCTYGDRESDDVVALIDTIQNVMPKSMKVVVWGNSMGASTALHAAAKDKRLALCISESSFSSLRAVASDFLDRKIGYHIPWMCPWAMHYAQLMASFDADRVDATKAMEKIECLVLLMHGTADDAVYIEHGRAIAQHIRHKNQRYVEFEGATHYGIRIADPERYDAEVRKAFELVQKQRLAEKR